jgi:fructose-specific component phosphotransferase system IIB-like protein
MIAIQINFENILEIHQQRMIIRNKRKITMKNLITAAVLTAFISIPATAAFAQSANMVIVGGHVIGQDPDANVRLQLRRDAGSENNF